MINAANAFLLLLVLAGATALDVSAQSKKTKRTSQPKASAVSTPQSTPQPQAENTTKRNERPGKENTQATATPAYLPVYFYEFTRPGFLYERISIEHNDAGYGKISFLKKGSDEMISDPIHLTAVTMGNLTSIFSDLNFLASNEIYQAERDYPHMGNVSITLKKNGVSRTAAFNWTENRLAKLLMDEYRRISNEYTWKFEIALARENQPLQAPSVMATLENYIKQKEISDPPHLIPLLNELSTDERIPLIARDRAGKIIKQIEKMMK